MVRVGSILAAKLGGEALVTGDSVGQVASQTMRNINIINRASASLILRPLVGTDKDDIVAEARQIGTFDISEVQCADSCTVFAPNSPATNPPVHLVEKDEASLALAELLRDCLDNTVAIDPETGKEYPLEFDITDADIQAALI